MTDLLDQIADAIAARTNETDRLRRDREVDHAELGDLRAERNVLLAERFELLQRVTSLQTRLEECEAGTTDPVGRMKIGAAVHPVPGHLAATVEFERRLGVELPIARRFDPGFPVTFDSGKGFAVDIGARDRVVSFKGSPNQQEIEAFLRSVPEDGFETYVAHWHEPDKKRNGVRMDRVLFKARSRRLLAACRAVGRSDVHPVFVVMTWLERDESNLTSSADYFPDEPGEWIMLLDPYDVSGTNELSDLIDDTLVLWERAGGTRWGVAETGTKRKGQDAANWWSRSIDYARGRGAEIFLVFSSPVGDVGDWQITEDVVFAALADEIRREQ